MPISFPTSPLVNDTYTYLGKTWTWTGAVWQANNTPMGPTGATGALGPTGPGATVAVGSTTTTGPGASASVVNTGTSQAAVLAFTIPAGPTGPKYASTVADKSANYSIVSGDAGTLVRSTGSAITVTVDNVLSLGQQVDFVQYGSGQITFAAGTGATVNSAGGKLKTNVQYSGASVICVASGIYWLVGDLSL